MSPNASAPPPDPCIPPAWDSFTRHRSGRLIFLVIANRAAVPADAKPSPKTRSPSSEMPAEIEGANLGLSSTAPKTPLDAAG